MNKIKRHTILPSGYHVLWIENSSSDTIKIEILTEEEYQHFNWWQRVLIKFNLTTI